MLWLYIDIRDVVGVSLLAANVVWMALPSLLLFLIPPLLLKLGLHVCLSMAVSTLATVVCYGVMVLLWNCFNVYLA